MASIKKKPDTTVSGLGAPTMGTDNHVMTATWSVPAAMTKSSNKARAENLVVDWTANTSAGAVKLTNTYGTSQTSAELNLDSFSAGGTSYSRSAFYPATARKLSGVSASVTAKNRKGLGNTVTQTRAFGIPPVPTVDEISFNTSTGICSTTIYAAESSSYNERYDTKYRVTVRGRTGSVTNTSDSSSTSAEFTLTYDASDYMNLTPDQYIQVTVAAFSRGYAGDSKEVSRNFYLAYPSKATITSTNISAKDSTGKLTVNINTNKSTEHPVDKVTLEYLANTTFENASDITGSWTDAGIEDNGNCTALAMPVEDLIPDRGRYTWVRVKTMHAHEGVLFRYSEYVRLKELETPPAEAAEDSITIISAVSGAEGESAVVQLGWNASGTDDSTGTELTWSDEADTWKSTKEPEIHEFTWSDGRYPPTGTKEYNDSAEITIKGLAEGKTYYIRARRYYEGETTSYGRYSNTVTVITSEKPAGVVARCNRYVSAGQPLSVYWTFSGNGVQTEWQILAKRNVSQSFTGNGSNKVFTVASDVASVTSVKVNNSTTSAYTRSGQTFTFTSAPANNASVVIAYESFSTVVAKGEGGIGGTQISAQRLSDLATDNSLTFLVQVSTGSGYVSSESKSVTILHQPTLVISSSATMTAQPYSFTATSSRLCDLIVIVTSQGASGQFPQGVMTQTAGDTIYSDVIKPTWSNGSATVTLPSGLDFWDLGSYTLSVVAEDRDTKLRSAKVEKSFKVAWTNKAVDPEDGITLTPIDTVGEDGDHLQGVEIDLIPPTGCNQTDLYDIYRMDGGKACLIGEGFPLTYTVIDEYAPFGDNEDLFYRIAIRTVDGDTEYADMGYTLVSNTIRFDWAGGTLELPYGNSIGDNYKKSVEFRQHMDGSVDGYWNRNVEHGASYSSSLIRLIQPEEVTLARQLARYAGAVFVRTANGSAYPADVQVTDLSVKNKAVTAIAVDATEVGLTEEFMLPSPYEVE